MAGTFFDDPYLCGLPLIPLLDYDFASSCSVSASPDDTVTEFPNAGNQIPLDPLPPLPELRFDAIGSFVGGCNDFGISVSSSSTACPQRVKTYTLDFKIPIPCPSLSISAQLEEGPQVASIAITASNVEDCAACVTSLDVRLPCPELAATAVGGGMTVEILQPGSVSSCAPQLRFDLATPELNATATVTPATAPLVMISVIPNHRSNAETPYNDPFNWSLEFNFDLPGSGAAGAACAACDEDASSLPVPAPPGCCAAPDAYYFSLQNTIRKAEWDGVNWTTLGFNYLLEGGSSIATSAQIEIASCNRLGTTMTIPGVGIWQNTESAFKSKRGGQLSIVEYVCGVDYPCEMTVCADGNAMSSSSSNFVSSSASSVGQSSSSSAAPPEPE